MRTAADQYESNVIVCYLRVSNVLFLIFVRVGKVIMPLSAFCGCRLIAPHYSAVYIYIIYKPVYIYIICALIIKILRPYYTTGIFFNLFEGVWYLLDFIGVSWKEDIASATLLYNIECICTVGIVAQSFVVRT